METLQEKKTTEEESEISGNGLIAPIDGWKRGDICWINGHQCTVKSAYGGTWYVQDSLQEPRYIQSVPSGHTLYYLSEGYFDIGSNYLKLDIRQGAPESRH